MSQQPVQIIHAWNRSFLPTGGAEKVYLLLEVKGNGQTQVDRAPINISLVLDRSGSMEGAPLAYSKKACQFVTEQMSEHDMLSMVAFDDEINTVFEPQNVTHKDLLKQRINAVNTGGTTNLSGGLIQGSQYVLQKKQDGSVNRVILLSDGHANKGVTDRDKLVSIAAEYHHSGVGITAIGVGNGFDEELMEGMADAGGGNFYFVEKPDEIPGIISHELQGLLSVVAQNIQLSLTPAENVHVNKVYGYQATDHNGSLTLNLGDLYNLEVKSVLLELGFHPHTIGQHEVLSLEWQFVDVTETAKPYTLQYNIKAEFTNDMNLLNQPNDMKVEKQVKITESAVVIEEAMKAFDEGDMGTGKMLLKQQADQMLHMAIQSDDAELREQSQALYDQLEDFNYNSSMRKTLHEQKYRQMKRKGRN